MSFIERYHAQLLRQFQSPECQETFSGLKAKYPIFVRYHDLESLQKLFNQNNKLYAHRDEALGVLLVEFKQNSAVYPLIQLIFWPSLKRLYFRYCRIVPDKEELFDRMCIGFYQSVVKYQPSLRPAKIDVNIFLNTKKGVVVWIKGIIRERQIQDRLMKDRDMSEAAVAVEPKDSRDQVSKVGAFLVEMTMRKIITETQYDLIMETDIQKTLSQKQWAAKASITHGNARLLKHRAYAAIRLYMKINDIDRI